MKRRAFLFILFLTVSPCCAHADASPAADEGLQEKAIHAADRICTNTPLNGSAVTAEGKIELDAQTKGLLKQIAAAHTNGNVSGKFADYEGLLQEQIASGLKDERSCRVRIFEFLMQLDKDAAVSKQPLPPVIDIQGNANGLQTGTIYSGRAGSALRVGGDANGAQLGPVHTVPGSNWTFTVA